MRNEPHHRCRHGFGKSARCAGNARDEAAAGARRASAQAGGSRRMRIRGDCATGRAATGREGHRLAGSGIVRNGRRRQNDPGELTEFGLCWGCETVHGPFRSAGLWPRQTVSRRKRTLSGGDSVCRRLRPVRVRRDRSAGLGRGWRRIDVVGGLRRKASPMYGLTIFQKKAG